MITAQFEGNGATVRIHDEYFDTKPEYRMQCLNRIVTDSYKRRCASGIQAQKTERAVAAPEGNME